MSSTLFRNARIFDGVNDKLSAPTSVLIQGDRVESIGADGSQAEIEIDVEGRTLMPGLIDAHFHAYASDTDFVKLEKLPPTYLAQRARHLMEDALRRGFTTVRDVGGGDYGLWRSLEEGWITGPRLFYCGRAFSQSGGHGDIRAPHEEESPCGCDGRGILAERVDGPDEIRKAAREALRHGAHHLKIFVSGGIASPSDPIWMLQFSEEEILAIVDEARRRRVYVAAHAYTAETILRAVRLGVRTIEVFDEHKVTFVSVTQSFNTTTSMGRLTLNVLLSFAQFEREVTGERIRDKIAASRAKGMWMGGFVPWGYDAVDRKLVINEAEGFMSTAQDTLRVRIPLAQRSRNGRPRIQPPADYTPETDGGTDPHVLRNFAQAWSWRRKLESGEANTIEDLARSGGVTHRMVGRMLKLTYLAPALLEKLLFERVPPSVPVKELTVLADMDWTAQVANLTSD